jgi:hypothetical protein
MAFTSLADWSNFYVITGSSAGGLTGLTFVVIALAADARRVNPTGLRSFVTPTIVHFGTVLALAAFLCVPRQTLLSTSFGLSGAGIAGLVYIGIIASNLHHKLGDYVAAGEDWLCHVVLPGAAYALLLASAFLIWRHPDPTLYGVATASMLLLFVGIHNAWDIAVWMTLRKQDPPKPEDSSRAANQSEK